mmetsp:Transcript_7638/g.16274  ORF Transcript_7638/g.16274 Transcript_7638/m.16274 type:complete len:174 (+) Transcript_7638:145-666(+)
MENGRLSIVSSSGMGVFGDANGRAAGGGGGGVDPLAEECANCGRVVWLQGGCGDEVLGDGTGRHYCGQNCLWSYQLGGGRRSSSSSSKTKQRAAANAAAARALRRQMQAEHGGVREIAPREIVMSSSGALSIDLSSSNRETENAMFDFHRLNFEESSSFRAPFTTRTPLVKAV